jgi:hypothetical protein
MKNKLLSVFLGLPAFRHFQLFLGKSLREKIDFNLTDFVCEMRNAGGYV